MADNTGVRKTDRAIVASVYPDVCKTPPSMIPVPYQIIGRFGDGIMYSDDVRLTSQYGMNMSSRLSTVYGDEPGLGGGIISGVNQGYCRPITHAKAVRINGDFAIFHSSRYWMNCAGPDGSGNTIGQVTFVDERNYVRIDSTGTFLDPTNPLVNFETIEELEWWNRISTEYGDVSNRIELPDLQLSNIEVPSPAEIPRQQAADSNSQRTSQRIGLLPYADAGLTQSGDSVFAGVAVVKGRDPNTGIEADVLTISGQIGAQNEVQAGMIRLGASSDDGSKSIGMDVFTAKANAGIHNSDGTTGINIGASATAVGIEGTLGGDGYGLTGGLSVGVGAEGSIGVGDSDKDGKGELSVRVSLLFFTVGFRLENPLTLFW